MKKLFLMVWVVFFLFTTGQTSAHTTEFNGPIGATVHIQPADDPVAGKPSEIHVHFLDRDGSFSLSDCECKIIVSKAGEQIGYFNLGDHDFHGEGNSSHVDITFPEKGIYQILLTGTSKTQSFDPFSLSYSIRVERQNTDSQFKDFVHRNWTYGVIIFIFLVLCAIVFLSNKRKKRN